MSPKTFIFFGPSGAGKGTQAKILIEYLKKNDPDRTTLYIETGQRFRDFITEASYTATKTKEIIDNGGLLPEFLPIWIWSEYFVKHVSGDEHMVLDGLSRRAHEAPILNSAMKFYKREKPFVISMEVSRDWAKDRLLSRERGDDNIGQIEKRLDWFEKNVLPAIEYFKNNEFYNFITINGEQTIEEVNKEIMDKCGL
ncbi:MAG: adenylate kinase [Parcubacteria group bacterium Gr01-1014_46]|nr:MAG: adenylate kinase [Parcubacteria group bacterium Gr01-1014_46]